MIVFAIVSTKGGVGKTTLAVNLGSLLADLGMRVLLFDADVQPSASQFLEMTQRAPNGLTEVVKTGQITPACISSLALRPSNTTVPRLPSGNPRGKLDLVASDDPEGNLQLWLGTRVDRGSRIKQALHNPWVAERYDIVLIDTQGAVGHLQDAAVLAADLLISPVVPDVLTAREFTQRTQELLERLEPGANVGLAVPPMRAVLYRTENTNDSRAYTAVIRERFIALRGRVTVLEASVPSAVAYKKAATAQIPVHWMDPVRAGDTMHRLVWELIPQLHGIHSSDMNQAADSQEGDRPDAALPMAAAEAR